MMGQRMTARLAILCLLLGTTMAWSKRTHKPRHVDGSQIAAAESKVEARYSDEPKASESAYPFDGDHHYPKSPAHSEEYEDSEDHKSHKEQDEAQGNEESDDTIKDDEYEEHSHKGGQKEFKAGGLSFDKHLKDHKADNKEIENVKEHDVGEKFGGELTKEHKLGKHKEKSKGHKLHGFKNVYHKEEYGDHKTFHDEFLDTDHQHNYDDHHEHQEMHGGKFSKGFKHEGKNNKFDKGDEKHEWGKDEFDVHSEGKHDKGGSKSKHRHATKKHQGHFDANSQRQKNSVHKVKKGEPPYIPHGGHHGPHQAQIEPVAPHYNSHHEQINVPSQSYKPPVQPHSHHVPYDNSHNGGGGHSSHYHNHDTHHISHGDHSTHDGHHHSSQNGDYTNSGPDNDYHERTVQHPQHRSSGKELPKEEDNNKFIPSIKHEPIVQKHEPIHQVHEPIPHRNQPRVGTHESISQKHEPQTYKHEPQTYKHEPQTYKNQPHTHHLYSHAHKQPLSGNYGLQQNRKPVFQDNSRFRPSQPLRQEKFLTPFNERSLTDNHKIRYGFQPRNHQHHNHNHNHHLHHNSDSRYHQQRPFPRFAGFNHQHQTHGHHHSHHGAHKNHSHSRHTPSDHQQVSKQDIHTIKPETSHAKPSRSEDQHEFSQKHYE